MHDIQDSRFYHFLQAFFGRDLTPNERRKYIDFLEAVPEAEYEAERHDGSERQISDPDYIEAMAEAGYVEKSDEKNAEQITSRLCDEAEQLLQDGYPLIPHMRQGAPVIVDVLGQPDRDPEKSPAEHERRMDELSRAFAQVNASAYSSLSYSLYTCHSKAGVSELRLALSPVARIGEELSSEYTEETIEALLRGVYGRAECHTEDRVSTASGTPVYASILLPVVEKREESARDPKRWAAWVDRVGRALCGREDDCCVTVTIVPQDPSATPELLKRAQRLQELHDRIVYYSEADRGCTDTLNISSEYERGFREGFVKGAENFIHLEGVKHSGKDHARGSISYGFSGTRHQKNKRAELLCQRMSSELLYLERAFRSGVWAVELRVSATTQAAYELVTAEVAAALKTFGYDVSWNGEPTTAMLCSIDELVPLLAFPTVEFPGLEFKPPERFLLTAPRPKIGEETVPIGSILNNGMRIGRFEIPRDTLNRHAFVCGMTGSGKTNTMFRLLESIDLPFLVIEPVKGEYRALSARFPDTEVLSTKTDAAAGCAGVDILQMNPFWFPKGANIAFHIDSLRTIIASAFEMDAGMPNILEQCLYNVYVRMGWNIATGRNRFEDTLPEEYLYPTFDGLLREIDDYLDHSAFGDETLGNYRGAMSTRIRSFVASYKGLLLNTRRHIDYGRLIEGRTIIELDGLADDADKCLVMGAILVQYFEYLKLSFDGKRKGLQHLFVIEEAHRLFKNVKKNGNAQNGPDAAGQLVDSLSNIMAEIRAFGEGLVIVDQSPTKVAPDVIKNSATKIIMRIDDKQDGEILQSALLLEEDRHSIPSLRTGEALIRTEGMTRPCKVMVERSETKEAYSLTESFTTTDTSGTDFEIGASAMAILNEGDTAEQCMLQLRHTLLRLGESRFEDLMPDMDQLMYCIDRRLTEYGTLSLASGRREVYRELILALCDRLTVSREDELTGLACQTIREVLDELIEQAKVQEPQLTDAATRKVRAAILTAGTLRKQEESRLTAYETACLRLLMDRVLTIYWAHGKDYPVKKGDSMLLYRYMKKHLRVIG